MRPTLFLLALLLLSCGGSPKNSGESQFQRTPLKSEGTSNGGGGKGVKCGSSVTTLDLWEAVHISRLKLKPEQSSLDQEIIDGALAYVKQTQPYWTTPVTDQQILDRVKAAFFDRQVFIAEGRRLAFTQDATLPSLPIGCEFVQIAIYVDDGKIYTDREYWNQMSDQAKASLVYHEIAYLRSREFQKTPLKFNSDEARGVIGRIYSTLPIEPNFPDFRGKNAVWCGAGGGSNGAAVFETYLVEESRGGVAGVAIYFFALNGEYMLTKTEGFLAGDTVQPYADRTFPGRSIKISNVTRGTIQTFEIAMMRTQDGVFPYMWIRGQDGTAPQPSYAVCDRLRAEN